MAKFYGKIGFSITQETSPGVWLPTIVEKEYPGDTIKYSRKQDESPNSSTDNLRINMEVSILANEFAFENITQILYVEYMGAKWKVSEITPIFPRLKLTLGGVYNGE